MRKRRTRKEKIIATLHRKLQNQSVAVDTTISMPIKTTIIPSSFAIPQMKSTYFIADLKKSLLLTSTIIAFELFLFFILQKRIFGLSNIGF